jgi:hypothetical protein
LACHGFRPRDLATHTPPPIAELIHLACGLQVSAAPPRIVVEQGFTPRR